MTKKTLGVSPLAEYLSAVREVEEVKHAVQPVQQQQLSPSKKQRVTIHVPVELIERVKNAVYWEPGMTFAGFAEQALQEALEKLESKRGSQYPTRKDRQLKGGRPIS